MHSLFNTPRPTVSLPDVAGIVGLLGHARDAGLQWPKLWLQLPDGTPLRITIAGPASRTPGFLMLTDGRPFGANSFFGKISPRGALELFADGSQRREDLVPLLSRLAIEPAKVAAEFGHLTGNCCFCARKLADARSTVIGYGKTCAQKFGMPWGAAAAKNDQATLKETP